ncbi:MAG TPA: protein-disulfide reductase DsbD [Candidatus Tenderia electrophaga]|uniref:Thiol:disulfide interchange protein DsbD n=1 Tax=Candidatus Tenderia electrophaga TaxID=1748243 RepID=A0A832J638_9GAMM|nr:protein-disulfide reductase DsbD [Candidatus Tenderia electrophaga]
MPAKLNSNTFIFCLILLSGWLGFAPVQANAADDWEAITVEPSQDKGILGSLSSFGQKLGFGSRNQGPFIPPEQAFILSTEVDDAYHLSVRWDITDGYYLYRDKFSFELIDANGISIQAFELPRGKEKHDENFGLMEVFYNEIEARLPLQRDNTQATDITLQVKYQGCAEAGFCYPPMKQLLTLSLPKATGPAPTPANSNSNSNSNSNNFVSEQDKYANSLTQDSLLLSMLSFFGLGLLLTFTPCVLPMIPILSSIIAGQGSNMTTRRAFSLSLIYVLAMALTYTIAGVIAALFGSNLQAAFQNPWVLGSFSAVFVALALSMFGFYELQMPQAIQNRLTNLSNKQRGGSYVGVAIMGLLSALIVGPCIAAPLAGALIYIGQTGDALLGAAALFSLSMGMGAPLLLIGTSAGKFMPKAGPWMNTIKAIFGVLLIGVAIWMLERIIPAAVGMALWGILLVICAVYLGAFERLQPEASGWRKLWKGVGIVTVIYGGMLLIGAASGSKDPLQPLVSVCSGDDCGQTTQQHGLVFKQIKGLDGLQQALQLAAAQNKTAMLDFYADWCISCVEMEKKTFSDPDVQAALNNTILLQADVTLNDDQDKELLETFGLFGPPSILFFDTSGQELPQFRLMGFLGADDFKAHIKAAHTL